MIDPQSSFIPLYFNEEDKLLLNVLLEIEPEKRSSFIKTTLKQTLLSDKSIGWMSNQEEQEKNQNLALADNVTEINRAYCVTKFDDSNVANHENLEVLNTFSLEDLFNEVTIQTPTSADPNLPLCKKPLGNATPAPWDNLLRAVIGEEEDATVIAAIKNSTKFPELQSDYSNSAPITNSQKRVSEGQPEGHRQQLERMNNQTSESELIFDIEALKVNHPISPPGLVHLMKSIIGTEDDDAIIQLLKDSKSINNVTNE